MIFDVTNFGYDIENLKDISSINNKLFFYIRDNIDKILKDYQNPNLDKYKPKGGYEFIDKSNNEGLGIYHAHLCKLDGKIWVLIWYLRENNQNYFDIFFEVMIHPSDDYKQVLSDIKNDPMNINPYTWKHFLEKLKILNYYNFIKYKTYMRGFLIIDTEEKREKIEVTNTQINSLIPVIKKINKNQNDYEGLTGFELFKEIVNFNIEDITSINIVYHH